MIGLLTAPLDEAGIAGRLAGPALRPVLPAADSPAWAKVAANPSLQPWIRALAERAEAEIDAPLPKLSDAAYAEVRRTGIRLPFERIYFERRRRVARAAMCLLVAPERSRGRWIISLTHKLGDLADEKAWALPAHVRTATGIDASFIDLFGAETANLMAEMIGIFGTLLPAELVRRIRARLETEYFDNYLSRYDEFWWARAALNWNAVCTQGVVGAALAVLEDVNRLARMLIRARQSLPIFLSSYGQDGACPEGPAYWEYGFGWFSVLNEQLEARSAGQLSLFGDDPHIREIARYGPRVSLPFQRLVNFSDAPATGILRPALLAYLGQRLGDARCAARGRFNYRQMTEQPLDLDGERQDFFQFARLFLHCPAVLGDVAEPPSEDAVFPSLGILVAHGRDPGTRQWDFAAKAGANDEPHNHNDCGSYLLNVEGEPIVAEIGFPEYVADYFGPGRYEFLAARSLGHSLPLINGCEQMAGPAARSRVIECTLGGETVRYAIDATACYPAAAGCRRFVRSWVFRRREGRLEVRDEIELAQTGPVETAIITALAVRETDLGMEIRGRRAAVALRLLPGAVFAGVELHRYSDHLGQAAEIRRIRIVSQASGLHRILSYALTGLGGSGV